MDDVHVRIALTFPTPLTVHICDEDDDVILDRIGQLFALLHGNNDKLDVLTTLLQERTTHIMSQLSDALAAINDATNADAASAAAASEATDANATAVQALRDQIAILIRDGGTPTTADLATLDTISKSLGATKASLDATAARLLVIAKDPNAPVPANLPPVVPIPV